MKTRLITATVSAVTAAFILASPAGADDADLCVTAGNIAEAIMAARQEHHPLHQTLALMTDGMDEETTGWITALTLTAYGRPAYATDGAQRTAIAAFRNRIELACYLGADE